MREHLGFLRTSSVVVKVAAWIFLFIGILGVLSGIFGRVADNLRPMVFLGSAIYALLFFFLFLIAKIADLLIKIINEIHEIKSGQGNQPGGTQ